MAAGRFGVGAAFPSAGVERDTDANAELRLSRLGQAKKTLRGGACKKTRVAEDVHQQSVGAVGTIEFMVRLIPRRGNAVMAARQVARRAVHLGQTSCPCGIGLDAAIAGVEKIAMRFACLISTEDNGGYAARCVLVP